VTPRSRVGCSKLGRDLIPFPLVLLRFFLQNATKKRADERTRTAELSSLGVSVTVAA